MFQIRAISANELERIGFLGFLHVAEQDLVCQFQSFEEHQLILFLGCKEIDSQLLSHRVVMAEGLHEGQKTDFATCFQVEGKKMVEQETGIRLRGTKQNQFAPFRLLHGKPEQFV
uniref:Uncharacterized protein n=1 Tax=Micrurus paraensis TaxID=1970185 RepID=A0A2D4KEN6_9SAUR